MRRALLVVFSVVLALSTLATNNVVAFSTVLSTGSRSSGSSPTPCFSIRAKSSSILSVSSKPDISVEGTTARIESINELLVRAAETKSEDSDRVVEALLDLEKLTRQQIKKDPKLAESTLQALSGNGGGSWRLIFTTGTINTQEKRGRVNYFPIKAMQSFNSGTDPWLIENGIYVGDFPLVKFKGDFDWTVQPSGVTKLTFDFTSLTLFGFLEIQLKRGEAARIGASTGLGSEGNKALEKQGKRAFFNWISADDKIATARGGGGGLALWKRVDYEGGSS